MASNPNPNGGFLSNVKQMYSNFKASLMPVSKRIFVVLASLHIISMLYSPLYYSLANIPYFITYSQHEVYRVFTSILVDSFSLQFIFSLFMFPYTASRIERRDGSVLLVYRMIVITILTNIFFTLISWPILASKHLWGFSLRMAGFGHLWITFLLIDMIQDPEIRRMITTNRCMMIMAVLLFLSFLFSVSSLPTVIIALLFYWIPGLYSPRKHIAAFFIPFPIYRTLQAIDVEEARKAISTPSPTSSRTVQRGQPVTIASLSSNDHTQPNFPSIAQGSQMYTMTKPTAEKTPSRFQGKAHTLGGNV